MIGKAISWLASSRVGQWIAGAVAAIGALWVIRRDAYQDGKKQARLEHEQADHERAEQVREKADKARRAAADSERDVDDRLRDHGRFRD